MRVRETIFGSRGTRNHSGGHLCAKAVLVRTTEAILCKGGVRPDDGRYLCAKAVLAHIRQTDPLVKNIITACWGVFLAVWLLAAIFTKRAVYRESGTQRLGYMLPIAIGCYLLFRGDRLPYPFNIRTIPHTDAILVVSSILCVCGVAFCFWARAVLGRNWSGSVTLKENHELIVRGPYRLVRHPIYTGLLAMVIATAIQQGHMGGVIGFILISVSLWIKSSLEEEVMGKQFPDKYPVYRERVKRLIPFIL